MKSVSISKFGPIAPFSIIYDEIRIIFVTFGLEPTQFQTPTISKRLDRFCQFSNLAFAFGSRTTVQILGTVGLAV